MTPRLDVDWENPLWSFSQLDENDRSEIVKIVNPVSVSPIKGTVQKLGSSVYSLFGEKIRLGFSSMVKRSSRSTTSLPAPESLMDSKYFNESFAKKVMSSRDRPSIDVVVSHDVDYKIGYENVLNIAEAEANLGIKSSYYFLVKAGYKIQKETLKNLLSMGHEVGLHGYTYDLRLAYRSLNRTIAQISKGKDKLEQLLGEPVVGFRNHSLLFSPSIVVALSSLNFHYQSGVYPIGSFNQFNTNFVWPFKYSNYPLFEIPVTWPQDAEVFRVLRYSEKQAIPLYIDRAERIAALNGVSCLNHHPSLLIGKMDYYKNLLKALLDKDFKVSNAVDLFS